MDHVQTLVTAYCRRSHAAPPAPRANGSYVLHLEGAGDIEIAAGEAPETIMLRATFRSLQQESDRQDALRWLMHCNLILAGRKHATLTLDEATDSPFLYDLRKVDRGETAANQHSIVTFANEVAAFRKLLERRH
jgi:hypothetical protein